GRPDDALRFLAARAGVDCDVPRKTAQEVGFEGIGEALRRIVANAQADGDAGAGKWSGRRNRNVRLSVDAKHFAAPARGELDKRFVAVDAVAAALKEEIIFRPANRQKS